MRHGIKILYLVLALGILYALWPAATDDTAPSPSWDVRLDDTGRLRVLGVTLGKSTLKEAEEILHTRTQRAMFLSGEPGRRQEASLEAYAPSLPDNSRMVLVVQADAALLEAIKAKAHSPLAFPSGSIKLEIADEHSLAMEALIVNSLTYIPRIKLTPDKVKGQFGEPARVIQQDGILHLLYPAIGLDAIMDSSGETQLQFVNPTDFQRVLDRLGNPAAAAGDAAQ